MGVVARQSFKKSLIMYLGVLIGAISTLFIYPLQLETYGTLQFLIATSSFFLPFVTLGISSLTVRFFPEFKDPASRHHGFFGLLLLSSFTFAILIGALLFLFRHPIFRVLEIAGMNTALIQSNGTEISALIFTGMVISLCSIYMTNFKRIVIPTLIGTFPKKIIIPILVLCVYTFYITNLEAKWIFIFLNVLMAIGILLYVRHQGQLSIRPNLSFLTRDLIKRMAVFSLYGILLVLGSMLTFRIDIIMVATMVDLKNTGIYTIALFIANIIIVPTQALSPILAPQISEFSYKRDRQGILEIYQKSSLIYFILGTLAFMILWFNLNDIISFFSNPEEILPGKNVVLLLGLAKLVGMAFGLNSVVLTHSIYFRVNVLFIVLLGCLTVASNFYFIPRLGMQGAALATLISISIFNIVKFVFIWAKMDMQPFTKSTLIAFGLGLITWILLTFWPDTKFAFLNIILKSGGVLILFGLPVYFLKLSPDLVTLVENFLRRVKKILGWQGE